MTRAALYFVFLLCALTFCACGKEDATREMADGLCSCMRPMADAIRKMEELAAGSGAQSNLDTLQRAMSDIGAVRAQTDDCINQLEARFGDELEKSEVQVRKVMAERCPEVVAVMQEAEEQ